MKKIILFLFLFIKNVLAQSPEQYELYNACNNLEPECIQYISGVRFGYARGIFEESKKFLCKEATLENIRHEVIRTYLNGKVNSNDDKGFMVIDAINSVCGGTSDFN